MSATFYDTATGLDEMATGPCGYRALEALLTLPKKKANRTDVTPAAR
jgi:hypothetical protein